ncbi:MAG: hypothetical protein K1X79_13635 [Oligoflexia bacterium]|nr:hypothetical protein [Oligoflexia bacterium]
MAKRDPLFTAHRLARSLGAVAILLALLGLGNILFATYKYEQYLGLLSTATSDQTSPSVMEDFPLTNLRELTGRAEQNFRRIKVRLDFYAFVASGGKVLVGAGLVMAVVAILAWIGVFGDEANLPLRQEGFRS